jgi:glycosyltransferase involved in cell wall biosynthesis
MAQEWNNHEVIVVNDGSSDGTAAILQSHRDRIRVIDQPNRGVAAARNMGVAQARGKYIAFLDSDDMWLPGKLAAMVPVLERNPSVSLAFSEYSNVSENGVEYQGSSLDRAPSLEDMMVWLPPILTSTWVVPREMFQRSGGFSEAFIGGQGFEDSWLLLRLREIGEFGYVSQRLTRYRITEGTESADKYAHALSTFVSLVMSRYGARGKALSRSAKNLQCRWILSKIARQMDRGERFGALVSLTRILRIRPAYLFGPECIGRLVLPQNLRRIRQLAALSPGKH